MRRLTGAFAAVLFAWGAPAASATWVEQAQADLICSGMAEPAEQQTLAAPLLPVPLDAKSVTAYFRGPPRDERHGRFRHLTALAAIGWWADQVNDQALRNDVYLNIGVLADHYAADSGDAVFRQAARCARAHLIDANLELGRYATVDRLADNLAKLYPAQPPANSIEDWPLLLGAPLGFDRAAFTHGDRAARDTRHDDRRFDHARQPGRAVEPPAGRDEPRPHDAGRNREGP